jgi:excisionase family DNA binding protein
MVDSTNISQYLSNMAKRLPTEPEDALYVRLPSEVADRLDRAATTLGIRKKDLIAGLVSKYVDPDSRRGLSALGALSQPRRVTVELGHAGPTLGAYSFQAYDPPDVMEVMNAEQAGQLLQLDEKVVLELAESGVMPGRKLGKVWRFSRTAIIAWLSSSDRP